MQSAFFPKTLSFFALISDIGKEALVFLSIGPYNVVKVLKYLAN